MKTIIRDTSLSTYRLEVEPTLGERQKAVYELLANAGENLTNSEIAGRLNWPINTVTPRIFELRKAGMVMEDEKRECRVTGRTCYAWRVVYKSTLF